MSPRSRAAVPALLNRSGRERSLPLRKPRMVCLSLLTLILFIPASSVAQSSSTTHLTHIGTSSIGLGGKAAKTLGKYRPTLEVDSNFNKNANEPAPSPLPSDHLPTPPAHAPTRTNPGF